MRAIASRLHFPRIVTLAVVAAFVLSGCLLSPTGDPQIVADESAVLTGTLRSSTFLEGATYWFEYGTSTAYGSSTPRSAPGIQQGTTPVSEVVDGLTPGTTYHYRLCSDLSDT